MSEYVMQTRQILSRCSRYSTICCSEGRGASVVYGGRTESRMLLRPLAENPQDTLSDMIFLSIKGYEETRSTLTMGSNAGTCKETLPYGGSTSNMIWHRLTKLWHVETAASIVVPCSSQLSNRWSCSDFAMWGGSSHWSTRSCVRALERMKHHETSQFPHLWPQIAQKTPTTHYHSKVCSSLPSKTPLHCHLCPDASPGPVDDTLHGFAHQWHGDSHAARCTGQGPQTPWQDEAKGSKRKFQECSHQRNDAKLHLFSTLHYPLQQPMSIFFHLFQGSRCLAYRLKPPGHHLQPARHQPQRQNLRYLSLLPAVRLDDANTRVMCKHPKYPKSQFLNLSWVYAQLHYIQAHLEPHHNCWWSSIFPPCLLVF